MQKFVVKTEEDEDIIQAVHQYEAAEIYAMGHQRAFAERLQEKYGIDSCYAAPIQVTIDDEPYTISFFVEFHIEKEKIDLTKKEDPTL